jgi:putative copper resistance protein D
MAGLGMLYLALQSPIDAYAGSLLSVHMVQHLVLTMVAAPLLIAGMPITLALQAASRDARKRFIVPVLNAPAVEVLSSPLLGWALFAVVMWGSHLRPIYEAALRNQGLHALEHVAYLSSALLFWSPVIGLEPRARTISHAGRLLYLFLAMPVTALLGLAMYSSDRLLYPYYGPASSSIGVAPLADQHLAGAIMWEGGMLLVLPALAFVLLDWMRRDEREALRADARRVARQRGAPVRPAQAGAVSTAPTQDRPPPARYV